ncbi:HmuY family protein [Belliella marina]|uniref:HmuY family protein n=1 Tax=Belliella marina TaxID=1644146 RepID=A0ABW4VHT3_9BACT
MKKLLLSLSMLTITAFLYSCDKKDDPQPDVELDAQLVSNIEAPGDVIDRTTGTITKENPFVYFSLEENKLAESKDGNWDIGFKGTTIIINSGISGAGSAQAFVATGIFDEFEEVDSSTEFKSDSDSGMAIPTGSGNGWYNYNSTTHIVSPIPGRIVLVKTNAGNYAKIEILSYYKDNPALEDVNPMVTPGSFYTFRFVLQPNGSMKF